MPSFWQIRSSADFFVRPDTEPNDPADIVVSRNAAQRDKITGDVVTDNRDWVKAQIENIVVDPPVFVRAADVVKADNPPRIDLDIQTFVEICTVACEVYNRANPQQVGVSRDYLIALAAIMNGAQRLGFNDQMMQGFDPFKFTTEEWAAFCASAANTQQYKDYDRLDGLAQIDAALARAAQSVAAISGAFAPQPAQQPPIPAAQVQPPDSYVPDGPQLFLAQMLGDNAAIAALKDRATSGGGKLWSSYVAAADLAGLRQKYPNFLNVTGADTLEALLGQVEDAFSQAYTAAAKAVGDARPQEAPPLDAPTPWVDVALKELGVGGDAARIHDYLLTTTYRPLNANPPWPAWCGAFVNFCLKQAGQPTPAQAQAAVATWASWGSPVGATGHGQIPKGAIVILSKTAEVRTFSHVTFFWSEDPKNPNNILVLGGNQGSPGEVNDTSSWPRTHIVGVRWPSAPQPLLNVGGNVPGPLPGPASQINIGTFTANDWALYCQVLGKRESTNNYRAVNRFGYAGRWQFGAAALCTAGYVKPNAPQRLLKQPQFWTNLDGVQGLDDWLNTPAAQDKAMLVYTRTNYLGLKRLGVVDASRPKAEIAGYLAAAHLTGVGGAKLLKNNQLSHDGNGVTSRDYFNLLSGAFAGR